MNNPPPVSDAEVLEMVKQCMIAAPTERPIDPTGVHLDASLSSLGIDSVRAIEIAAALEERLRVRFPDEHLARVKTVRDLVNLIRRSPS